MDADLNCDCADPRPSPISALCCEGCGGVIADKGDTTMMIHGSNGKSRRVLDDGTVIGGGGAGYSTRHDHAQGTPLGPDCDRWRKNTATERPEIGDYIHIPAWRVSGMVTAIVPNAEDPFATDTSTTICLQERPDGPERRYRLEPGEWWRHA